MHGLWVQEDQPAPLPLHGPVRSRLSLARGSSPSWVLGLNTRWGCVGCDEARERGADGQRWQDVPISAWGREKMLQDVCLQEHCGRRECAGRSQLPKSQRSSLHRGTLGLQAAKRETGSLSLPTLPGTPKRPQQPQSPAKLSDFHISPPQTPAAV